MKQKRLAAALLILVALVAASVGSASCGGDRDVPEAGAVFCGNGPNCPSGPQAVCVNDGNCAPGQRCLQGQCVQGCVSDQTCPSGQVCVDGFCGVPVCDDPAHPDFCPATRICVDLGSDPNNCGQCGIGCAPGTVCANGACQPEGCQSDADCPPALVCQGGNCINPGTCVSDAQCPADQVCESGNCVPLCSPGFAFCPPGQCVNLGNDNNNCGECGFGCAPADVCVSGVCVPVNPGACVADIDCVNSPVGASCCNGSCTDTTNNDANCGKCGNACAANFFCSGSECILDCPPPLSSCGDPAQYCADLQNDPANCGDCGNQCAGGALCINYNCSGGVSCVVDADCLANEVCAQGACQPVQPQGCGLNDPCLTGLSGVCALGHVVDVANCACAPNVAASNEVCNGLDDDCDGQADENLNQTPCNTGFPGVCAAGTLTCANGVGACQQSVVASPEVCDGLDNNCNGQSDEGNPGGGNACPVPGKVGPCANGTTVCTNGAISCLQGVQAVAEACNGIDDDCNGAVDNGDPGGGAACATGQPGLCASGTKHCTLGNVQCSPNNQPVAEVCDGLDNNCNGQVDDGNPGGGAACQTGKPGPCAAGTQQCQGGSLACVQSAQPVAEVCDGLDNDCDGNVDDGNPGGGAACATGQPGLCAVGVQTCKGGGIICQPLLQASPEVCDGFDNNCNGAVDEGNPGGGAACNTGKPGVCSPGTNVCQSGSVVCVQNVQPGNEVCDAKDNDCNGLVDEGNPGGGAACNTGKPGVCAAGANVCQGGVIVCVGPPPAPLEVCNGLDDTCNGNIDEGNPGGGAACNTGKPGVCAPGTIMCSGGALTCAQAVQPVAEVCDGKDNNCNGFTDEGNPGGGAPCQTGLKGICSAGTTSCINGGIVCQQNLPFGVEICGDGLDNDCDGLTDEPGCVP